MVSAVVAAAKDLLLSVRPFLSLSLSLSLHPLVCENKIEKNLLGTCCGTVLNNNKVKYSLL